MFSLHVEIFRTLFSFCKTLLVPVKFVWKRILNFVAQETFCGLFILIFLWKKKTIIKTSTMPFYYYLILNSMQIQFGNCNNFITGTQRECYKCVKWFEIHPQLKTFVTANK